MAPTRLDPALLQKLAKKTGKSEQYIREQISRRASRLNIASEAAQVLWAKGFGIGTAAYQSRLQPHLQQQIAAAAHTSGVSEGAAKRTPGRKRPKAMPPPSPLKASIDYLLSDEELRDRCADLLMARKSFDRVFREATVVLDQRLKRLGQIKVKMNPADLVAKVLHPRKAILIVSDHDDEQQGFFELFKGLMAAFRNPAHHSLNDKLTREDALRFCGFIDALLSILQQAKVNAPTT